MVMSNGNNGPGRDKELLFYFIFKMNNIFSSFLKNLQNINEVMNETFIFSMQYALATWSKKAIFLLD